MKKRILLAWLCLLPAVAYADATSVEWSDAAMMLSSAIVALGAWYIRVVEKQMEVLARKLEESARRYDQLESQLDEMQRMLLRSYLPKEELKELITATTTPILERLNAMDRGINTIYQRILNY